MFWNSTSFPIGMIREAVLEMRNVRRRHRRADHQDSRQNEINEIFLLHLYITLFSIILIYKGLYTRKGHPED